VETAAANRPAIDTRQLFGDTNEVLLVHDEVVYRLRITKAGKLILTK
jgi:hemin uptake protein HemP